MSIEKDLQEVIRKNLPSEVGDTLKEALRQGEKDALTVKRLETQVLKQNKDDEERKRIIASQEEEISKAGDLTKREADLSIRENALKATLAADRANEAEKRANGIYELVSIVFRSPQAKRMIEKNGSSDKINPESGYNMGRECHNETTTITDTEE